MKYFAHNWTGYKIDLLHYLIGLSAFLISILISFLIADFIRNMIGIERELSIIYNNNFILSILFILAILIVFYLNKSIIKNDSMILLYGLIAVFFFMVLINIIFKLFLFKTYGDVGYLPMVIDSGNPFSRWLGGTKLLIVIYNNFQEVFKISAINFIKFFGATLMALTSILFIYKNHEKFSITFPIFSPIWLLFSSGYDEYYPFIVGLYLLSVSLIASRKTPENLAIPIIAAILPVMYIGFAPLGLILLFKYWIDHPKNRYIAFFLSMLFYFIGLIVLWPADIIDYIKHLYSDLNLGEKNTFWPPYQGKSSSSLSPFFSISYALSLQHFMDLFYMLFFGAGWITPLVILALSPLKVMECLSIVDWKNILKNINFLFYGLLFWQIYYFIFMIPKLGPSRDFDLFFGLYIVLSFMAGALLDDQFEREKIRKIFKYYIYIVTFGSNSSILYMLLFIGN
ncbi:MAG: hypothetical protein H6973_12405 [Gammaproteobacteria bacterium]|nr:hypothetical protein [Gammaproteobacteria bacterium]HRX70687.1 hypothetical protein [Candidatus Competibacteraceae bacterium]